MRRLRAHRTRVPGASLPPRWAAIAAASSRSDGESPDIACGALPLSLGFTVARSESHGKCSLLLVISRPHESDPPCKLSLGGMTPASCPAAEGAGKGGGPAPGAAFVTNSSGVNLPSAASEGDEAILH